MHFQVRHEIRCRFDVPARNLVSVLRLSPRSHEGQHVSDWWIDSDIDCSLRAGNDEFGNLTHTFSTGRPVETIAIKASGRADTFDTAGVTRGTVERLPLEIFLRETPLTAADDALRQFADAVGDREPNVLGKLHALMGAISTAMPADADAAGLAAAEAFRRKTGGTGNHAHIFIAAARHLGIPTRYVSGYLIGGAGRDAACHAWAEAYVPSLGWVGFDPVHDLCPEGGHLRCAVGFDALGAAFIRGTPPENTTHLLDIRVAA